MHYQSTMKTKSSYSKSKFSFATTICSLALLMLVPAQAARAPLCSSDILTSTVYFVPHVNDYCKKGQVCEKFRNEVRLQGSGLLNGNKVLRYTGKTESMNDCDTAKGAAGTCLIPYISVAADPNHYRMGDILKVPHLKGKVVDLGNGKSIVHPGTLIVQDTGGAIKGSNRVDIFTGTLNATNENNDFGFKGPKELRMSASSDCDDRKKFSVVRRGTSENKTLLTKIETAVDNADKVKGSGKVATSNDSTRGVK